MPSGFSDWHKATKTDVVAQTLDQIKTDIVAQTVDNLSMDIAAQSISKVGIDVKAQSIAEQIIFGKMGVHHADYGTYNIVAGGSQDIVNVSGRGVLLAFLLRVNAQTDSETTKTLIRLDGSSDYLFISFQDANNFSVGSASLPIQIYTYTASGVCSMGFMFSPGLSFDSSLLIRLYAPSGYWVTGGYIYAYSLI